MDTIGSSAELRLRRYIPDMAKAWDEFVDASASSTFLLRRGYMDYHSDRFRDHSLLAFKGGRTVAMLPANLSPDGTLHSHQGLTYGGWIIPRRHFDGVEMISLFEALAAYCRGEGIGKISYKPMPWIYHSIPAQEDLYALFRTGGRLVECNLSSAIDLRCNPGFNTLQRRHLRSALKTDVIFTDDAPAGSFMEMLADCLRERHGATPVHTVEEISLLMSRFPDNIRIFTVGYGDRPEAGVCMFDTGKVAHCQYIATTPEGRRLNLLTALFSRLITDIYADRDFFDFGISNEDHGRYLNAGLLRQKRSLGGSGVAYERYEIEL